MAQSSVYLTATTTAQNVTLNGPGEGVAVVNLDGAGFVAVRNDGVTAAAADDNTFVAQQAGAFRVIPVQKWPTVFSVYASTSVKVSVEVVNH